MEVRYMRMAITYPSVSPLIVLPGRKIVDRELPEENIMGDNVARSCKAGVRPSQHYVLGSSST